MGYGVRVNCRRSSKEIFYLLLSVFFDLKASFSGNFWVIIMKTTSSIIWSLLEVNQTLKKPLGENSFILNYYQTLTSSAHIYNRIFSKFAYYLNNLSKSSHFMIYQKSKKSKFWYLHICKCLFNMDELIDQGFTFQTFLNWSPPDII